MPTKEQIAESLKSFEALLGLAVTSDASNEKATRLAECVYKQHHTMFWSRINFSASKIVFNDEDENAVDEADDTLLMSQNKTLQVSGAAATDGDQLRAGPSGNNNIVGQDDDDDNSGSEFTEVRRRRKKKTSGNQSKRPPVCRSTWRGVKCERTACGHAHPPLCKLKSCFPQRDYKCKSWHGSGSSTAASGNCSGGRGPPPYPKSQSSTNARSNKPNGSSLGLRALQDKLAISDLRLEVARLKTKQKAPTLPKRGIPPTPFSPPSQPQLSQLQDLAGLDLVGMLAIMQQQQFGVQLAAITASLRVTSKC
jgi:hypothetical protein